MGWQLGKLNLDMDNQIKLDKVFKEEFSKAILRSAKTFRNELGRQYAIEDSIASGRTVNSIKVGSVYFQSDQMSIDVGAVGDRALITNFIEYGRSAGKQPPFDEILTWLRERKILTDSKTHEHNLARAIARNIAEYGIEGKFLFRKAKTKTATRIRKIIEDAAKRVAERLSNESN